MFLQSTRKGASERPPPALISLQAAAMHRKVLLIDLDAQNATMGVGIDKHTGEDNSFIDDAGSRCYNGNIGVRLSLIGAVVTSGLRLTLSESLAEKYSFEIRLRRCNASSMLC